MSKKSGFFFSIEKTTVDLEILQRCSSLSIKTYIKIGGSQTGKILSLPNLKFLSCNQGDFEFDGKFDFPNVEEVEEPPHKILKSLEQSKALRVLKSTYWGGPVPDVALWPRLTELQIVALRCQGEIFFKKPLNSETKIKTFNLGVFTDIILEQILEYVASAENLQAKFSFYKLRNFDLVHSLTVG